MKKVIKGISAVVLSAVLLAMTAVTAFATSVKTGDTVEVKISVEGENSMGSMNAQILYDKSKFDLLSDETLEGMGVSNTTVDGEILWAAMFETEGSDFTAKTDVYSAVFVAKQDISDFESLFTFTLNDAYKIGNTGVTATDPSYVKFSAALENEDTSVNSVTSNSDNSNNNNNVAVSSAAAQNNSKTESKASSAVSSKTSANVSSAAGSKTSANVSSAAGSKADESSKPAESSSKAASSADNKDSESQTDTAAVSDNESTISIIESYDEAEFASVPPIKLDEDTSSAADSRGAFPKGIIIGVAVCLVIAAAGIAAIMAKKKG